jgi:hypothetical protein
LADLAGGRGAVGELSEVTREQLEHLIRAAATLAADDQIVVVGSQAILGAFPAAPQELLVSVEADLFPLGHPERAELIDGSIGEGSPFHETFGYYAHGVGPETAVLPAGWRERLIPLYSAATRGATGLCLEPHDLVLAKLVAGREKDLDFAAVAVAAGLVLPVVLRERLRALPVSETQREQVAARLRRVVGSA